MSVKLLGCTNECDELSERKEPQFPIINAKNIATYVEGFIRLNMEYLCS